MVRFRVELVLAYASSVKVRPASTADAVDGADVLLEVGAAVQVPPTRPRAARSVDLHAAAALAEVRVGVVVA